MASRILDKKKLAKEVEQWNTSLHPLTMDVAASKLGLTAASLRRHLDHAKKLGMSVQPQTTQRTPKMAPSTSSSASPGRSLEEFQAQNDKSYIVPRKVKDALKALGTDWLYEAEFAKLAGVNLADLGHFRSLFEENIVAIRRDGGKRAWAGKATAAKMREMLQ